MMDDIVVFVGQGLGVSGGSSLEEALWSEGFTTERVSEHWPRDRYVFVGGRYVDSYDDERYSYGEGGNVLDGDGYILCSPRIGWECVRGLRTQGERQARLEEVYPDQRQYLLPWVPHRWRTGHEHHIDLVSLLLPKRRVLIIDTYLGKWARSPHSFQDIAQAENLTVIRYDSRNDLEEHSASFALNALVLADEQGEDLVFLNSRAGDLIGLLGSIGVRSVPVNVPYADHGSGSIRCSTNIARVGDPMGLLTLAGRNYPRMECSIRCRPGRV